MLEDKIYISSDYYSFRIYPGCHSSRGRPTTYHSIHVLKYQIKSTDSLEVVAPEIQKLDIKLDEIEKSVFQHFMLKKS